MNIFHQLIQRYAAQKVRIRRLSREGGWIVAGQAANVLGSLALVRILTEYLEPADYGQLALGLTIAGFFTGVIFGGISNGIVRYFSIADEQGKLGEYFKAIQFLCLKGILATALVTFIAQVILIGLGRLQWAGMILVVAIYATISSLNAISNGVQNAARQRAIVALHGCVDAWLKIGFAVAVIHWFGVSGVSAVVGYTLSAMIVLASQIYHLQKLIPPPTNRISDNSEHWVVEIWKYGWPFIIWGVFGWVQQSSTRWAIEAYVATADLGQYAVLSQLGYTPVQMATSLMLTFLTPILFAKAGSARDADRRQEVIKLSNRIGVLGFIATLMATLVTWAFHYEIFALFASSNYRTVSQYLPIIVLAGGLFAVAQVFAGQLMSLLAIKAIMPASIGSSIIGIVAAFVCTYLYGISGAVLATLIHSISYLLWILISINALPLLTSECNDPVKTCSGDNLERRSNT